MSLCSYFSDVGFLQYSLNDQKVKWKFLLFDKFQGGFFKAFAAVLSIKVIAMRCDGGLDRFLFYA